MINNTKKKPFADEVVDEMGDGPGDDYAVEMDDAGSTGDDDMAHEDRVMAVKKLGGAMGVQIADPEAAAEALKAFIESCG